MNREINFSRAGSSLGVLFSAEVNASDDVLSVQVVSAGTTVTVTYECSNDGTNWVALPGKPPGVNATAGASTSTSAGILVFPISTRFVRASITVAGTGTVSGVAMLGVGSIL